MRKETPKLKFDLYALSMIEEYANKNALIMLSELERAETDPAVKVFSNIKVMCWAGQLHQNEKISMREAVEAFRGMNMVEICDIIIDAVKESDLVPSQEQAGETPENPPKA